MATQLVLVGVIVACLAPQIMEFVEAIHLVLVGVIVACLAPQIMEFIVEVLQLVVVGVIVACQAPQIMEFIVVVISLVLDGVIVACQAPQIMEFIVEVIQFIVEGAAGAVPAVVDVPVIMQRRDVRRHPCRGAQRFSSCIYIDKVIDAFCAGPAGSCAVVGDSRDPTVAACINLDCCCMPVVVQRQVLLVDGAIHRWL